MHGCGFGCQISTLGFCLMLGYALNRTVTVKPSVPSVIQPLSTTCTSAVGRNSNIWGEDAERFQVVNIMVLHVRYKPDFFPPAVPEDLADRMTRLHSNPFLWWAGQISSYVFRPTKAISEFLREQETKLGFFSPIVGIHIRRTDKLQKDAKFHFLDEYMILVDRWYDKLEERFPKVPRRMFLATDDPGVKSDIHSRYPEYEVLTNDHFSLSGEDLKRRRTESGLLGIMHDIHMLSKCDYLVCRLAYQLMQSLRGNATQNAVSLDRPWFYWGQYSSNIDIVRAKMPLYGNLDVQ